MGTALVQPFREPARFESDPLTVEFLFRRHAAAVHRRIARLLGPGASSADVDDVTQQVFIEVHRSLGRFRGESKVTTWLFGIAYRKVLRHLRDRRRHARMVHALEGASSDLFATDLGRRIEQRDELRRVWTCLMNISPKKRIVYVLYEIEGVSGDEIAQTLSIRQATVWTRLYHARRELLRALAESGGMP